MLKKTINNERCLVRLISYIQKKWKINLTEREMSDPKIYNLNNLEKIILKKIKNND